MATKYITISMSMDDYELIVGYCDEMDYKVSGFLRRCAKDVIATHLEEAGIQ